MKNRKRIVSHLLAWTVVVVLGLAVGAQVHADCSLPCQSSGGTCPGNPYDQWQACCQYFPDDEEYTDCCQYEVQEFLCPPNGPVTYNYIYFGYVLNGTCNLGGACHSN